MATGVCRICGHSFSSWNVCETICPNCISENLHNMIGYTTVSGNTISANNDLGTFSVNTQKIALENSGIKLVIDNDTIKSIDSIEVNGIKFERVK